MKLDEGMLDCFRDVVGEMTVRFGISRVEAVARVNEKYGSLEISPYPDLMCHELPEFWAHDAHRPSDGDGTGRLPAGDGEGT